MSSPLVVFLPAAMSASLCQVGQSRPPSQPALTLPWTLCLSPPPPRHAEGRLLSEAVPLCDELKIKWSSCEGVPRVSKGHEIILQNSGPQTFWCPSPSARDPRPCLEVEFKDNHVITAIELKGIPNTCTCDQDM